MTDSRPYVAGSDTSRAAAAAARKTAPTTRAMVLALLTSRGAEGATDQELAKALRMSGNTVRPRRAELVSLGEVIDSGDRRETSSGRTAVVWRIRREGEEPDPPRPTRSRAAPPVRAARHVQRAPSRDEVIITRDHLEEVIDLLEGQARALFVDAPTRRRMTSSIARSRELLARVEADTDTDQGEG